MQIKSLLSFEKENLLRIGGFVFYFYELYIFFSPSIAQNSLTVTSMIIDVFRFISLVFLIPILFMLKIFFADSSRNNIESFIENKDNQESDLVFLEINIYYKIIYTLISILAFVRLIQIFS